MMNQTVHTVTDGYWGALKRIAKIRAQNAIGNLKWVGEYYATISASLLED